MSEDQAYEQRLNPFPHGGYRSWNFGIVPTDGIWYPLGASTAWSRSVNPWPAVLILGGASALMWLIKRVYRGWMTVRQKSLVCLHCGNTFEDSDLNQCEQCGAARPMVTVSSQG